MPKILHAAGKYQNSSTFWVLKVKTKTILQTIHKTSSLPMKKVLNLYAGVILDMLDAHNNTWKIKSN